MLSGVAQVLSCLVVLSGLFLDSWLCFGQVFVCSLGSSHVGASVNHYSLIQESNFTHQVCHSFWKSIVQCASGLRLKYPDYLSTKKMADYKYDGWSWLNLKRQQTCLISSCSAQTCRRNVYRASTGNKPFLTDLIRAANLTSVAGRHCCYLSVSLIANSRRSRRATVARKCRRSRQHVDENSNFCGMKSCTHRVFDLLEKNAMSALSFSSVQYLSGVKLNGDASIFVVAVQSFLYAAA